MLFHLYGRRLLCCDTRVICILRLTSSDHKALRCAPFKELNACICAATTALSHNYLTYGAVFQNQFTWWSEYIISSSLTLCSSLLYLVNMNNVCVFDHLCIIVVILTASICLAFRFKINKYYRRCEISHVQSLRYGMIYGYIRVF